MWTIMVMLGGFGARDKVFHMELEKEQNFSRYVLNDG